jgi:hypothetical protein
LFLLETTAKKDDPDLQRLRKRAEKSREEKPNKVEFPGFEGQDKLNDTNKEEDIENVFSVVGS